MDYLLTFIEGIASFISPCVLPMIPIYISYFATKDKNIKSTIINAISFVLGFTVVFILLGVFVSTLGKILSEYSKYINIFVGILVIVLGMNYLGIIKINFLNKSKGIKANQKDLSFISSFLFGMIFSISWTPCVGAFLSTALLMASTTGSILKGVTLLLTYSLGLGIPFIITAVFLEKLKTTFDVLKRNYNVINKISGAILIIIGLIIIF